MDAASQSFSKKQVRAFFFDMKKELSCVRCGEDHPAVLEFHHVDKSTKKASISELVSNGADICTIIEELDKCEVVCSNCHRIEHYEQHDTHKYRELPAWCKAITNPLLQAWRLVHPNVKPT